MTLQVAPSPAEVRADLRRLIRAIEARPAASAASPIAPRPLRPAPVHDLAALGLVRRDTPLGACMVRDVRTPLSRTPLSGAPLAGAAGDDLDRGTFDFTDLEAATPASLALLAPNAGLEDTRVEELLFLDIETTGLGGAGAMTFLVATGRIEGAGGDRAFVLRQYLAPSPADEAALLHALIADAGVSDRDPVLVTYNGRAFDAPALDQRATMHRQRAGFEVLRHLDLLMPVRTAYRGLLPSCRLGVVEHALLGMTRPATEVGGAETPAWYFRYLRTPDSRIIAPLLAHNARDVLALASLTGRLAAVVGGTRPVAGMHALGAGRLLAARGEHEAARAHLERAFEDGRARPSAHRAEAAWRLAALHKGAGRRDLAEPLWLAIAASAGVEAGVARGVEGGGPPGIPSGIPHGAAVLRPLVELAIYYERHLRDAARALEVVERALRVVAAMTRFDERAAERWRERLLHRQRRVHSKADRATLTR